MPDLSFGVSWRDDGVSRGLKDLAAQATAAEKAQENLKRAQLEAAGAARKIAIEEAKLKELRESGKAKASQILSAEDRLASARHKSATATEAAAHAAKDLGKAEDAASGKAGKARGAFAQAFSHLKIPNPFGGLSRDAKHEGKVSGAGFGGAFKSGLGMLAGAAAVLGGISEVKTLLVESTAEARESQKVGAVTTQIIKATGGAAKISAGQVGALTTAISNKTGVDDEAIQKGANLLLTFKNVRNEVGKGSDIFDRATQASTDLSAAGFGSITSSSKMLGKALNDPVKGISALSRAGVTFTDQQKAQIKTLVKSGDVLGAQKLIMKEVESQVGGVAAKSATAGEKLKTVADNTKEAVGTAFLPLLDQSENLIAKVLPGVGSALAGAVGDLTKWVSKNKGAIKETFGAIKGTLKTFGALASSWIKPFVGSLTKGGASFKDFADFLGTHQEDITRGLIAGARFTISFAEALGLMASAGLRAFAFLMDAQADMTAQMLLGFKLVLHGSALAFGWIPGVGDKLKSADAQFDGFARGVVGGMHKAADGARGLADGIDTKMTPALKAARAGLDKMAKQQIWDAQKRDQAERARIAIDAIGTKANGSQIKLKHFNDITKLGAGEQAALRKRLVDAHHALGDQITAMQKAGAGQGELTKAWKTGRDRLYDEFIQMGISKKEAQKLADKYAGIPPKKRTKFEQPGMADAKRNADQLKTKTNNIPNSHTIKINWDTAVDGYNTKMYASHGKMALQMQAASGAVIPGFTPGRDVHQFYSPTGGRLALSGGEAVMVPEWTRAIGGPAEVARQNRAARSGQHFANGGIFGQTVASAGTDWVESQGTAAVGAVMKRLSAAGLMGGKGYTAALNYVKAHSGHPYQFATIWDCSGLMGSVESIIQGRSPNMRRWSTPAFAGGPAHAQGFTRNKRSAFMIGVNPSPGKFGHTAGTLNGVNVESSGGVGVHYGKGARGWNNAMFPLHYGFAGGGVLGKPKDGDLPFDTLDPRGNRYNPRLAKMLGFSSGGVVSRPSIIGAGESGPERVLSATQTRAFDNLVRVIDRQGGAVQNVTYIINAPNYVGSQTELVSVLVKLNQQGRLQAIKR